MTRPFAEMSDEELIRAADELAAIYTKHHNGASTTGVAAEMRKDADVLASANGG